MVVTAPEPWTLQQHYKNDRRQLGEWGTRYPKRAWAQILFEFGYLLFIFLISSSILVMIGYEASPGSGLNARQFSIYGFAFEYPRDRTFLLWLSVGLSGVVGGTCFALKWLYHSVAKWEWNRDRALWRFIVPLLSGAVAVFASALVASGVIAILDSRFFAGFYGAIGAGWLIGYFSDSVLAALQRLAHRWFGTVDESAGSARSTPPDQSKSA